ncbi:hypothetical protein FY557_05955 [Chryseobacterium sp. SN22]|uniref:hypothetical protein n=1 Tax=Chryseobacterium sp. SN22 TaxID=2606431 RepID=UPI0011EECE60|nr:hypothetical protein [Chryseobacterium sp. SN22]KAA0129106.1 hypothetical protein FY557_05955 [Chryseobacterium sp. SN22]
MFSEQQEQAVTDYLILHKLPLDILLEVKDHMISQVAEIQAEENKSFEEAFHQTQKLWESEFRMTKYPVFYAEEIPVIVKKIVKTRNTHLLKKSLLIGLVSLAISFVLIYLANDVDQYTDLFRIQNGLFIVIPVIVWAINYKMLNYIRYDHKYEGKLFYTMYQQNAALTLSMIGLMAQIIVKEGKYPYLFFREHNDDEIGYVLVTLLLPYIVQVMIIFVMLSFFEHKKSLVRIERFLNAG